MEKNKKNERYGQHIYIRVVSSCAASLKEEAVLLGYRNTSLLIRYLIRRRDVSGPLYSVDDMKVLAKCVRREMSKEYSVISLKLTESLYGELDSEWRSVRTRSLPSYVSRLLEARYLPKETRFFY